MAPARGAHFRGPRPDFSAGLWQVRKCGAARRQPAAAGADLAVAPRFCLIPVRIGRAALGGQIFIDFQKLVSRAELSRKHDASTPFANAFF